MSFRRIRMERPNACCRVRKPRRGTVLLISMVVLAILAAWAVSINTLSGSNLQIAENQRKADAARACAESGLDVIRFWSSQVMMPSSTPPSTYLNTVAADLQSHLDANGISNLAVSYGGFVPDVMLDSATGRTFSAQFSVDPYNQYIVWLAVTGTVGDVSRTIRVAFEIEPYEFPIFNFGLATKGALHFPGNPTVRGASSNWEADIYVESPSDPTAVFGGGNVNFDGNINIGNPGAGVDFQQSVQIAGDHGQTAIDNHVFAGVDPVEFPVADTEHFRPYATGDTIDPSTDTSSHMLLTNVTIAPGTNPTFGGNVIIQGILFIEPPNVVTFEQNLQLNGLIVAPGDPDNPGTNHIIFYGNFATGPYPPGAEFDQIRSETGSSILAPGFAASFAGNFSALDGVVAVSGADFSGNVCATVKGTIINYSEDPLQVAGNATMVFDRSASTKVPAGFDLYRVLNYDPNSYSEM